MQITAELHKWRLFKTYDDCLLAEGYVFNDTKGRFNDDSYICTSYIVWGPAETEDGLVIRTENSVYLLVGEGEAE